ncbi:unnamed protein product, partial [Gongylonema pulchrum]|uniref:ATG12 n=1 Tax=Gongylonema pulchrum TaxID=637853 RepID=A0A183EJA0_9BILA
MAAATAAESTGPETSLATTKPSLGEDETAGKT